MTMTTIRANERAVRGGISVLSRSSGRMSRRLRVCRRSCRRRPCAAKYRPICANVVLLAHFGSPIGSRHTSWVVVVWSSLCAAEIDTSMGPNDAVWIEVAIEFVVVQTRPAFLKQEPKE